MCVQSECFFYKINLQISNDKFRKIMSSIFIEEKTAVDDRKDPRIKYVMWNGYRKC